MIQYKEGKDLGLDMHTDASDVTVNVCLGKQFTGAELVFCGYNGEKDHRKLLYNVEHKIGQA